MPSSITIGANYFNQHIGDVVLKIGNKNIVKVMRGDIVLQDIPTKPIIKGSKIMFGDSVRPLALVVIEHEIRGSPILVHNAYLSGVKYLSVTNQSKYSQRLLEKSIDNQKVLKLIVFDGDQVPNGSVISVSATNQLGESNLSESFTVGDNGDIITFYDPLTGVYSLKI